MMNQKIILATALAAVGCWTSMTICSCSNDFKIEDQENVTINEVVDGNTVVLDNGLTVHLYGVSSNSTMTQAHLNGLVGKTISLLPDSQGEQEFLSYDDEIWAYAMIDETGKPLNRELLELGGESAFSSTLVSDSLIPYQEIVKKTDIILTKEQIGELLNGSSFIIWGKDKQGKSCFNGTGFFISKTGLALSCSHVVNYSSDYSVQLATPDGKLIDKLYSIKLPLFCGNHNVSGQDYAIFYVDLDDNTKSALRPLSLAKKTPLANSDIYTVGNPGVGGAVLPMSVASGTLANPRFDDGLIQADINIGPGFSGGPEVDKYGKVFGINQSIMVDPNLNSKYVFLTDIQTVRAKLDELNEAYEGK